MINFGGNRLTQAAILNNMGCKFLEHGAFREAFEMFGDAVDTFHESFLRGDTPSQHQVRIDTATARLCKVNLLRSSLVRVICVDTDEFTFESLGEESRFGKFMMYGFFLTVLRETGLRNLGLDSAIILYNYALSHIFILKYGLCERKAFRDALRLMRMSLGLLYQEMKTRGGREQTADHHQFRDISTVYKVMTTNYSYMIAKRGRYSEAKCCYNDMDEFLNHHPHHEARLEATVAAA